MDWDLLKDEDWDLTVRSHNPEDNVEFVKDDFGEMEGPETLSLWIEKRVKIKSREMESTVYFHLKLFLHQRCHLPFIPLESQWRQAVKDVVHSGLPSICSERYFQSSLWLLGTNHSWWQSTWSKASMSIWLLQVRPILSNPSETDEFNSVEISRPVIFPITDVCFSYDLGRVTLSVCSSPEVLICAP